MNTRYVPSDHTMSNSVRLMVEGIPEQSYQTSLDPSYSRAMYPMTGSACPGGIPSDHSLRPTHLGVNYDCGYPSDMSFQSRLVSSIGCSSYLYVSKEITNW